MLISYKSEETNTFCHWRRIMEEWKAKKKKKKVLEFQKVCYLMVVKNLTSMNLLFLKLFCGSVRMDLDIQ